ncbi:carbohydrate ABC transporter permease [Actinomyces faecalis]|uniref:carbohydrate ABC transporter permease n=1 Tax=Actinomyces faecalis TaxID=2722820 RepID=UPI001FD1DF2C|nr:sugar ABC transporter permease [Actinomyces faecalis]
MTVTVSRRRASRARRVREAVTGYLFLTPSVLGVVLFMVVPVGVILWLTVHQWDLIAPPRYVGLDQVRQVLTDASFLRSLRVTLGLVALVVPAQILLGLFLANMLTKGVRGTTLFRTLIVIPWISSPLALGVVWSWIFAPTGGLLSAVAGTRLEILVSPTWALPAVAFVVLWNNVGYTSLFFIAGLLAVPRELIEAAYVDGASARQVFWRIKVPMLRPTFFFVSVTSVIAAFNIFDHVYALTSGGPAGATKVLAYEIYEQAFVSWDVGKASVMALVMMLILLAVTVAQNLYFRTRTTYEYV